MQTHVTYQPVPSLSSLPWSLLFAFCSCTLPWYSHISPIVHHHHHHKAQVHWTDIFEFQSLSLFILASILLFCQALSNKQKRLFSIKSLMIWNSVSTVAFYDLNRWSHEEVCEGNPLVLSHLYLCVCMSSLWVVRVATQRLTTTSITLTACCGWRSATTDASES